jgi:hypothetical protein
MVIAAFFIASAVIILALGAFQGAARAQQEKTRASVAETLGLFLTDVEVPETGPATGKLVAVGPEGARSHGPIAVQVTLGHHTVTFEAQLPNVMVRYAELVERFASAELRAELHDLQLAVGGRDTVSGSLALEPVLTDTLVTLERRLALVKAVADLAAKAPIVLLERVRTAHGSRDLDDLLLALAYAFPQAPETEAAITHATTLVGHHKHDGDRIRERAAEWRAAGRLPAFPVR